MPEEKYILKIDTICKKCGYRNYLNKSLKTSIDAIACGHCGEIIQAPAGAGSEEMQIIKGIIKEALGESL